MIEAERPFAGHGEWKISLTGMEDVHATYMPFPGRSSGTGFLHLKRTY
jgi:hypothetical protein